jgi:hypothetical protein
MNFPKRDFYDLRSIGVKSVSEVQSKLFKYLSNTSLGIFDFHEGKHASSAPKTAGTRGLVNALLRRLTKQQRVVIFNRYGLWNGNSWALRSIGKEMGLSGERIRQIEKKSLLRLHAMFGNGMLSGIVARKISNFLDADATVRCGILTRDEASSCIADDCSQRQAALALSLFNDVECPEGDILTNYLLKVEPGVYCVKSVAHCYMRLLKLIESTLEEKPVSESKLRDEILGQAGDVVMTEQLKLMRRMLSISPTVIHLGDCEIALSRWIHIHGGSTSRRAEAVLRRLERPAHFREISKNIPILFGSSKEANEGTVHNAVQLTRETFIRVGAGTYGLKVWGLRAKPRRRTRRTAS